MPHLSPMNWISTIILFWMILLLMMTSSWWTITPQFPKTSNKMVSKPTQWIWT